MEAWEDDWTIYGASKYNLKTEKDFDSIAGHQSTSSHKMAIDPTATEAAVKAIVLSLFGEDFNIRRERLPVLESNRASIYDILTWVTLFEVLHPNVLYMLRRYCPH